MNTGSRRRTLAALAAPALALGLGACGGGGRDASTPLPANPIQAMFDPAAINIGSVGWRTSTRDAFLLAARQVNDAGGVLGKRVNAIALVARDNAEAQEMGRQLLDGGVSILNVSTSTRVLNLLPLAQARGVPILTESGSSPALTTLADGDLVFRVGVSDVDATPVLARVAFDAGKRRAVVLVNEGDAFGAGLDSLFSPAFQAIGGQVVRTVAIPFGLKSGFAPYLKQVFDANPDVILNGILAADISANVLNESLSSQYAGLWLLPGTAAGNQTFADNLADPGQIKGGASGAAATFGLYDSASYRYFRDSYVAQYASEPQDFTAPTYDIVMAMALAIERAGRVNGTASPTPAMIRDSLRPVMNAPGAAVRPEAIGAALALVRQGADVDYGGAYADIAWDARGDIAGAIPFTVFRLDAQARRWDGSRQIVIDIPRSAP
ncbi:ABC transporter substrate-binding protein [Pseudoduganella namucuonensis]|uniref:ABC-type branched-chain amino acid transport system, substrate-binding protein n=1 Tax=Pseudoduganella namucuonensis TaxID=1035707 RepID=A0A1I7HE02_9BURK|nr:ABC transporter substrate-binding protein [Pseudoduganella namucuonensis]SFU58726.1 ABC-type branched-chain amino acid transport system, substrate-binding protein [Pseudoduganella namucuonensis]